jgi:hypothetical protein
MAYIDGTRSATAQCDLSLSYNILVYPNDLVPFVALKLGYVDGSIGGPGSHTGAYSTWTWSWTSTPHAPNWQWFIYLTMTSNDGYGHSTTVVKTVASGTESFATEWVGQHSFVQFDDWWYSVYSNWSLCIRSSSQNAVHFWRIVCWCLPGRSNSIGIDYKLSG